MLGWDEVEDEDFDYYTVYGSDSPVLGGGATLIGYTIDTGMDLTGHYYDYYHVTATDFAGNEGEAAGVENTYAGSSPGDHPTVYALRQNKPNPFGERTVISFDLPVPELVRFEIYDTQGKLVRVLSDEIWPAGRHSLEWRGENEAGRAAGSGPYYIRITAGDFTDTRKVLLTR